MKRILLIICVLFLILFEVGCNNKKLFSENSNASNSISKIDEVSVRQIKKAYYNKINYKGLSYYGYEDSISLKNKIGEKAREFYKLNSRKVKDYIITDYKDGICINKYCGDIKNGFIKIPEKLDGKKVVKLGSFLNEKGKAVGVFSSVKGEFNVELPKSVKEISKQATQTEYNYPVQDNDYYVEYGQINDFVVSKENPYYMSQNGALYSKNQKWLLFLHKSAESVYFMDKTFKISDKTEYTAEFVINTHKTAFGKNIKKINAYYDAEDITNFIVKGYKNTAAKQWAKKCGCKFVALG